MKIPTWFMELTDLDDKQAKSLWNEVVQSGIPAEAVAAIVNAAWNRGRIDTENEAYSRGYEDGCETNGFSPI